MGLQLRDQDKALAHKYVRYHPSVWGDHFILHGQSSHTQEYDTTSRVEELKEEVRSIFKHAINTDLVQTMNLLDSIQLLGVDYHFEKETKKALSQIYGAKVDTEFGLEETALRFRLLRQQGYRISPDVFNKFKDENKNFMSSLKGDVKGLLSLYDAAYLRTHGETILDEAIVFTRGELTSILSDLKPPLDKQVLSSLNLPLCRRMRRLLAREHISIFQEEPEKHGAILELAKLDYDILQSLHCEEVKDISIWGNEYLAPNKNFNFARDRVVEGYYWVLGVYFEPKYSCARVIMSKVLALISILDDIYDAYSTLEESQLLTQAIERWDANVADELPEYMKLYYLMLIDTFEKIEDWLKPKDKYCMFYLKEMLKALARGYLQEHKWATEQYVASLEEHLHLTRITSAYPALVCASFVGMSDEATEEAFKWLIDFPTIVKATSTISRILNDIKSHALEQTREHVASTVQCYMKGYGVDIDVACDKLRGIVEDAWKDMNKELENVTVVPMALLERIVNLARMLEVVYKEADEYTHSSNNTKDNISILLVQSVYAYFIWFV